MPSSASLSFTSGSAVTVEAWVYASALTGQNTILTKGGTAGGYNQNYALQAGDGTGYEKRLVFFYRDTANAWHYFRSNDDVFATGVWHHVAVTYTFGTGSLIALYVDGVLKPGTWRTGNGNAAPKVNSDPLWIGASYGPSTPFSGQIDDVRIWNWIRSQSQIRSSMEVHLTGAEPGLVGYWDFNDAITDQTVHDRTANANDGYLGSSNTVETSDPTRVEFTHPTVTAFDPGPDPHSAALPQVAIRFSDPISGPDVSDLRLTRNGGANFLTGSESLSSADGGITWVLGGLSMLTALPGEYSLQLTAAGAGIRRMADGSPLVADAQTTFYVIQGFSPAAGASCRITGAPGSRTLEVSSGVVTLNDDLGNSLPNCGLRVDAGASVILNASQQLAVLSIASGGLAQLAHDTTPLGKLLTTGNLDISGQLDLANNGLIYSYAAGQGAAALASVTALLRQGRGAGDWAGPGITSGDAANDPDRCTGLAVADNAELGYASFGPATGLGGQQILVRYASNGDSDLNGVVDANDYFQIDRGYRLQGDASYRGYRNGDIDYSGQITADDFYLIDRAFVRQPTQAGEAIQASMAPQAAFSPFAYASRPITAAKPGDIAGSGEASDPSVIEQVLSAASAPTGGSSRCW